VHLPLQKRKPWCPGLFFQIFSRSRFSGTLNFCDGARPGSVLRCLQSAHAGRMAAGAQACGKRSCAGLDHPGGAFPAKRGILRCLPWLQVVGVLLRPEHVALLVLRCAPANHGHHPDRCHQSGGKQEADRLPTLRWKPAGLPQIARAGLGTAHSDLAACSAHLSKVIIPCGGRCFRVICQPFHKRILQTLLSTRCRDRI
jgi:hypothetical protein